MKNIKLSTNVHGMDFNEFSLEKELTGAYGTRLRHLHGGE